MTSRPSAAAALHCRARACPRHPRPGPSRHAVPVGLRAGGVHRRHASPRATGSWTCAALPGRVPRRGDARARRMDRAGQTVAGPTRARSTWKVARVKMPATNALGGLTDGRRRGGRDSTCLKPTPKSLLAEARSPNLWISRRATVNFSPCGQRMGCERFISSHRNLGSIRSSIRTSNLAGLSICGLAEMENIF